MFQFSIETSNLFKQITDISVSVSVLTSVGKFLDIGIGYVYRWKITDTSDLFHVYIHIINSAMTCSWIQKPNSGHHGIVNYWRHGFT